MTLVVGIEDVKFTAMNIYFEFVLLMGQSVNCIQECAASV